MNDIERYKEYFTDDFREYNNNFLANLSESRTQKEIVRSLPSLPRSQRGKTELKLDIYKNVCVSPKMFGARRQAEINLICHPATFNFMQQLNREYGEGNLSYYSKIKFFRRLCALIYEHIFGIIESPAEPVSAYALPMFISDYEVKTNKPTDSVKKSIFSCLENGAGMGAIMKMLPVIEYYRSNWDKKEARELMDIEYNVENQYDLLQLIAERLNHILHNMGIPKRVHQIQLSQHMPEIFDLYSNGKIERILELVGYDL
jgi:hypothetical protein